MIGILLLLLFFFIFDYKSIETRIRKKDIDDLINLKASYDINRCEINFHLPALKKFCKMTLDKMNLIKSLRPSFANVFAVWITEIPNNMLNILSWKGLIMLIILIILISKTYEKKKKKKEKKRK